MLNFSFAVYIEHSTLIDRSSTKLMYRLIKLKEEYSVQHY